MRKLLISTGLVFIAVFGTLAAQEPDSGLILDENAYCRYYHQFGWDFLNSKILKEEGEAIFGKRGLDRLEKGVKKQLSDRKIDWAKTDWRDHAVIRGFRAGGAASAAKSVIITISFLITRQYIISLEW